MRYVAKGFMRNVGNVIILQEIMFAIIMTMIIFVLIRLQLFSSGAPCSNKDLAIVVFSMDVTWGAIDAVVVYFVSTVARGQNRENIRRLRKAPEDEAIEAMMGTLEGTYLENLCEEDRKEICRKIYNSKVENEDAIKEHERYSRRERLVVSLLCFAVTSAVSIPCVIAMLLVNDLGPAMALAGLTYTVALFVIGYFLGKEIGRNGYIVGILLAFLTMSIALVSAFTGG